MQKALEKITKIAKEVFSAVDTPEVEKVLEASEKLCQKFGQNGQHRKEIFDQLEAQMVEAIRKARPE